MQNFKIMNFENLLKCSSLYTFLICMTVPLMCLQKEGSGIEILNCVM